MLRQCSQQLSDASSLTHMAEFLNTALSGRIAINALRIALVVGTVLNLINQGEALFTGGAISWPHVLLNYLVPYCVASYSAAKNELNRPTVKLE
jgi:hypothetical protein